jgi:hypothetical protein
MIGAAALTFAAVGWYLGWYHVHSVPAEAGHRAVDIDVNTEKIGEDIHKGEQKIEQAIENKNATSSAPGDESKTTPPAAAAAKP